jgi:hypothetical protein
MRLAGYNTMSPITSFELLDQYGVAITPQDLTVEPFSNRLWVVSSNTLYCYDADLYYPEVSRLLGKNYDAECHIEVSDETIIRGETVDVSYIWRRPVKGIVKHRAYVEYPDGTKYSIIDGSITTYTTGEDSWTWGEPYNRNLRAQDTFTLSDRGDYVFSLEVYYSDETTSIDRRIVSVVAKYAIGQWSLTSITSSSVVGIDIDSEYKIWILNASNEVIEVIPHSDVMMIDYDKKIIYTREGYDYVRVL